MALNTNTTDESVALSLPSRLADTSGQDSPGSLYEALTARIYDATIKSVDEQEFVPADIIDLFTTRAEVINALKEEGLIYDENLVSYACREGKRVFLILVEIEKLAALESIYAAGFNDSHLPVGETRTEKGKSGRNSILYELHSINEAINELQPERWDVFATNEWNNQSLKSFLTTQWHFLAPVFTKDKFRHVFHQKRPMPYIAGADASPKVGFFSRVSQVRIHDAHQQVLGDVKKPLVAIKQLQRDNDNYYQREANTLDVIRELNNRHLIKPIATYQRGDSLCFMFPWATGGNLREFWAKADINTVPRLRRDADLVLWTLEQMCGLAKGLAALHDKNCRHGDLKPENVLRFLDEPGRGILQIADVGLAKFHLVATQNRHARTTTMTGTLRYEPPECDEKSDNPRSRGYDLWSMGCIYLEFLIWLLDGQEELEEFNTPGKFRHFWEQHDGRYQLHTVVEERINSMSTRLGYHNPKADTALKELLKLVKTRLLVVQLRQDGKSDEGDRATAEELGSSMAKIYERAQTERKYLFDTSLWGRKAQGISTPPSLEVPQRTDQPRLMNPTISLSTSSPVSENNDKIIIVQAPDRPVPIADATTGNGSSKLKATNKTSADQEYNQLMKLNDDWESTSDNSFAQALIKKIDWSTTQPQIPTADLCGDCKAMDIWSSEFKSSHDVAKLKASANDCDLCRLLYQVALGQKIDDSGRIELQRIASALKTRPGGLPVLSIYVDPDSATKQHPLAQLGFPILPEQGGNIQSIILNEWLRTCDENHGCLPKATIEGNSSLPTRVIYVGTKENPVLRLIDGGQQKYGKYIALSHCWGKFDESRKVCTYKHNLKDFKQSIDSSKLPATFKDAVRITRALKVHYLWIDSLCIIQDDDDDWEVESNRMEDVFSSAYCTLAASSAESSDIGFLGKREPRPCIKIDAAGGAFYVCKAIDNFHRDVEEGVLSQRGWVLQERALSRRSIYFTSTQVYWECGKGVKCETLAKLLNSKASFLGDSDFPKSALEYFKGGRILFFQSLYEMYSRLGFTFYKDRPIAIAGLEKRLVRIFGTRGGYGVFESYLQRGLLWQRPENGKLSRITYPEDRHVPSWSWMAYRGGIKYMKIPFDGADWTKDLDTPFNPATNDWGKDHWEPDQSTRSTDLVAVARKINISRIEMAPRLVFDEPQDYDVTALKCVVVGREKKEMSIGDPIHWVLVIRPVVPKKAYALYERVGVGYLLSSHLGNEETRVRVR